MRSALFVAAMTHLTAQGLSASAVSRTEPQRAARQHTPAAALSSAAGGAPASPLAPTGDVAGRTATTGWAGHGVRALNAGSAQEQSCGLWTYGLLTGWWRVCYARVYGFPYYRYYTEYGGHRFLPA